MNFRDIPRISRKLKKRMKKENRYSTKAEYIENHKEMVSMVRILVE